MLSMRWEASFCGFSVCSLVSFLSVNFLSMVILFFYGSFLNRRSVSNRMNKNESNGTKRNRLLGNFSIATTLNTKCFTRIFVNRNCVGSRAAAAMGRIAGNYYSYKFNGYVGTNESLFHLITVSLDHDFPPHGHGQSSFRSQFSRRGGN